MAGGGETLYMSKVVIIIDSNGKEYRPKVIRVGSGLAVSRKEDTKGWYELGASSS